MMEETTTPVGENPNSERPPAQKPTVVKQGKVIIEQLDDPDEIEGFLIMYPTGHVVYAPTHEEAERKVKTWFKRHLPKGIVIGVGEIEWRQ